MLPSRPRDPDPRTPGSGSDTSGPRLGSLGEDLAAAWLSARGFRIEGRNVRTSRGEIDLLARRRRLWVAVEVKTRRRHPAPERTVHDIQLSRVRAALRALAPRLHPAPRSLRVDVIAVQIRFDRTADIFLFPGTPTAWPP